jgi:DNA-directed RNA polymerase specialized sigma24 family protein
VPGEKKMTRDAFGSLYQQGFNQTVRFLISRGIPADNAAEAAQAGWATGWELRESLRNESYLRTWINRIALNFHRQKLRREARLCPLGPDIPCEFAGNRYAAIIETHRILSGCTPPDRALLMRWMLGATLAEIAGDLGISSTAARIRFLRARRSARSRLEKGDRIPAHP